ncbi:MAG: RNA polymerase factor sigma-54 [Planctomycetota bacterium]|nr:RNA polymerase factor sigma-54 [Planctomycetota bacterium]
MRLELGLSQKLSLQLKLAPQIIQSIEILQLPALSLNELVEAALGENEALERDDATPDVVETPDRTDGNGQTEAQKELEEVADTLHRLEQLEQAQDRDWQDFGRRRGSGMEEDRKYEAMYNTAAPAESLSDSLYEQFTLLEPDDDTRTIAHEIIYNLDDAGLLPYSLEEILDTPGLKGVYTLEEVERALKKVQTLEPKGIGARDIVEAILLQLDPDDPLYEIKHRLIQDHLVDINKNKRPKVARELGISISELNEIVDEISKLDPRPGSRMGAERNAPVHPDVVIQWVDGRYEIQLEDNFFPRIRVNPEYRNMLTSTNDPKVKDYVRKKLESAKWLVDAIQQRQSTLTRVCAEIFKVQRQFLDFGKSHLRPLKMQEVADRVGIHVSTVSRAIADKWVQTPRGIYPLKFFFTGGAETADGETMSRLSVKQKVQDMIDKEDKRNPLSDEQVAEVLKQQGLDIARRTVTKYRKALRIQSSRQRRKWD